MTETSLRTQMDHVRPLADALPRRLLARRPLLRHAVMTIVWSLIWLAVIAVPILMYAGAIQLTGNIDTVVPDKVYRSATLRADALTAFIRAHHIRTVINLRGSSPGQSWYQDDVRVTAAEHVRLIDIPLSAIHEPNPALMTELIGTLTSAETPMLIHCSSGSDRTGLAAALYELLVENQPPDVAARQLSFYWGHFPWIISPTVAMDNAFAKVVAGLPARN